MDLYEVISEEIDNAILDARKQKLAPDNIRKEVFKVMGERFNELNQIENFTSPLVMTN